MRLIFKSTLVALACFFAAGAYAQNRQTFVSVAGDNANDGTRATPCQSFGTAINKTMAGGEVVVLDAGNFGAVAITKSITLDGGAQLGTVLQSGETCIDINAGANDVVVLRNLRIRGYGPGGPGGNAINFYSGKALVIENCVIEDAPGRGVYVNLASAGTVTITNTRIIGFPAATAFIGVMIDHASAPVAMNLRDVDLLGCSNAGIYAQGGKLSVRNSLIAGGGAGIVAGSSTNIQLNDVEVSNNAGVGLRMAAGAMRISNCVVTGNGTGVQITGGTISTYGNNRIDGNAAGNGPLSGPISQQ